MALHGIVHYSLMVRILCPAGIENVPLPVVLSLNSHPGSVPGVTFLRGPLARTGFPRTREGHPFSPKTFKVSST